MHYTTKYIYHQYKMPYNLTVTYHCPVVHTPWRAVRPMKRNTLEEVQVLQLFKLLYQSIQVSNAIWIMTLKLVLRAFAL